MTELIKRLGEIVKKGFNQLKIYSDRFTSGAWDNIFASVQENNKNFFMLSLTLTH